MPKKKLHPAVRLYLSLAGSKAGLGNERGTPKSKAKARHAANVGWARYREEKQLNSGPSVGTSHENKKPPG
jgi:hypothetical protein